MWKSLHEMYHCQTEEVADIMKSNQWPDKADLKDCTETLILAAQEQALGSRSKDAPETAHKMQGGGWDEPVQHTLTGLIQWLG